MLVQKAIVGSIGPMFGLPTCHARFARAYGNVMLFSAQYVLGPDQTLEVVYPKHSVHDLARNQMAAEAKGEFLLFLDVDHDPPCDILFRLLNCMNRYEADVVSAMYPSRIWPYVPCLWRFRPEGGQDIVLPPVGEVIEVDCAGAGCLLVKTSVFRRIWDELGEEPFSRSEYEKRGGVTGEDFAFFKRLKRLGVKTLCDPRIECPHIEDTPRTVSKDMDESAFPTAEVGVVGRRAVAA